MNDAKIRIHSELIAGNIQTIAAVTSQLRKSYDTLYNELQTADPQYDRQFEYFMLHLTRTLHALESDHITSLAFATTQMRDFSATPGGEPSAQNRIP